MKPEGLKLMALRRRIKKQIGPGIAWPEALSDEVVVAHTREFQPLAQWLEMTLEDMIAAHWAACCCRED